MNTLGFLGFHAGLDCQTGEFDIPDDIREIGFVMATEGYIANDMRSMFSPYYNRIVWDESGIVKVSEAIA